jgi:hypothetical protein
MITLLDTVGPAIFRASWQAAVLALVVMLLLRSLGERIAPRWRYLVWSVVIIRLQLMATPGSPWSAFNLVCWNPKVSERQLDLHEAEPKGAPDANAAARDVQPATGRFVTRIPSSRDVESVEKSSAPARSAPAISSPIPTKIAPESGPSMDRPPRVPPIVRILSSVCLADCLLQRFTPAWHTI